MFSNPASAQAPNSPNGKGDPASFPPKPCYFLNLPADLYLLIYEELLVDPYSLVFLSPGNLPLRLNASKSLYPAILQTCKAISNEALTILYGRNTVAIPTDADESVPELTSKIRLSNASLIRRVIANGPLPGLKIEKDRVVRAYEDMGIRWEKLHVWVCKAVELDRRIKAWGKDEWVVRIGGQELSKLGPVREWCHYEEGDGAFWVSKRDSMLLRAYRNW